MTILSQNPLDDRLERIARRIGQLRRTSLATEAERHDAALELQKLLSALALFRSLIQRRQRPQAFSRRCAA